MKKILLFAALMAAMEAAAAFPSMMFHTADGTDHIIGATGLKISYTASEITACNADGATLTLQLADLESMEFSNSEASINDITSNAENVTVFSTDGKKCGDYRSLESAAEALNKGVYIVKAADGSTRKISLCK